MAPSDRRHRVYTGLLTAVAVGSLGLALAVAWGMLAQPPWRTPLGVLGVVALTFPLHVGVPALESAIVTWLAWRRGARLALGMSAAAALLLAALSAGTTAAQVAYAHRVGVDVSLWAAWRDAFALGGLRAAPARTETYGVAPDGTALRLDVWPAPGGGPKAALIRVHGGGWSEGRRSDLPTWDLWANDLGFHVFDVDYRLSPPPRWQDEVGDVKCALGWVVANADRLGVDPARIALFGSSAGGNLALLAATTVGDPALPPSCDVAPVAVRAVVNLYGPADLVAVRLDRNPSPAVADGYLDAYLGGPPDRLAERYRLVSPLTHVGPTTPPVISFVGTADRLVPAHLFPPLDAALAAAGVPHETWTIPWADHAYDGNWGAVSTQITRAKAAAFLRRHVLGE